MNFLLMDFGTTSVKTAIVDLETGRFSYIQSHPSVSNCSEIPTHHEISPQLLKERFLAICDFYFDKLSVRFEGIVICSEQNGFVVLNKENAPLTNYISWKDERSLEPIGGVDTYTLLTREWGDKFKRLSGWRPGPGLPIMNVTHLARLSLLESPCRLLSLPEWLASCCEDSTEIVHDTMLHGLGFYDVHRQKISDELTGKVEELTGVRCTFNSVAATGSISGYWHKRSKKVPIYVGIGDHQCSVLGACNVPGGSISINIGTGSQVAVVGPETIPEEVEVRPYFDDYSLAAVTRIPGGRALASYVGFLEDVCAEAAGHEVDFWGFLKEIDDISTASLSFDLAVFSSAWNYRGGGKIVDISEHSLTLRNYLSSLLKAFAQQYLGVARLFDPAQQIRRCILSGGVARRIPLLYKIISSLSGYETWPACELDESLIGLRTVALVSAKFVPNCLSAQEIYGRDCKVDA
jgi:sedoheptulokinase